MHIRPDSSHGRHSAQPNVLLALTTQFLVSVGSGTSYKGGLLDWSRENHLDTSMCQLNAGQLIL